MVRRFPIQAAASSTAVDALFKAMTALATGKGRRIDAERYLKSMPGDTEPAALILKAAVSGATTTGTGWAAELVQSSVADLLINLGPVSAGSQLLRSAFVVTQEGDELGTSVPSMLPTATGAAFVDEAAPIPVKAFNTTLVQIPPKKISAISAFTGEMLRRSTIRDVLPRVMRESVGLALDSALFSASPAGAAPAGLRHNVTATTAATGGGETAMLRDLGALAGAVANVGGDRIAFVGSPDAAVKIRLIAGSEFPYPVFSTVALPANTVLAVALDALAAAVDPQPFIEAGSSATLHFEDSAPAHIGTASGVAAPARSLFQTGSVALRIVLGVSWALRAPNSVAFTTVTW